MSTDRRLLLTGATGFVGRYVHPALRACGWEVRSASRDPERAARAAPDREWVQLDVDRPESLRPALEGVRAALYLVHGMGGGRDYEERERRAAEHFARAALDAGVERIVYLGGVAPAGAPSRHLRSRLATGEILRELAPGTVELRAAMIVGAGSASWQICRDLAARLPFMVLPRWLESRSQPIAIGDVSRALAAALEPGVPAGCYDIPGPEILSAHEILVRIAHLRGLDPLTVKVPVLSPRLSSYWLRFVTGADVHLASELVEGLVTDLIATGPELWDLLPEHRRTGFDDAARRALESEPDAGLRTRALEGLVRAVGPKWRGTRA